MKPYLDSDRAKRRTVVAFALFALTFALVYSLGRHAAPAAFDMPDWAVVAAVPLIMTVPVVAGRDELALGFGVARRCPQMGRPQALLWFLQPAEIMSAVGAS